MNNRKYYVAWAIFILTGIALGLLDIAFDCLLHRPPSAAHLLSNDITALAAALIWLGSKK